MFNGAITQSIDTAQVVLYMFWLFFAALVYYLHREDKREGYPLESDGRGGRVVIQGFPAVPEPKAFRLANGETLYAPGENSKFQSAPTTAEPISRAPGSPIAPIGDPMTAGVGPGAYAMRRDVPDTTLDGQPRIVPLRASGGFSIASEDPDPRGFTVYGCDNQPAGTVVDLWVDRSEAFFRYLEVEVRGSGRRVLLPVNFSRITDRWVDVASILSTQFDGVPATREPESVTSREEDRITAYYGAGTLYATPERQEPLL